MNAYSAQVSGKPTLMRFGFVVKAKISGRNLDHNLA